MEPNLARSSKPNLAKSSRQNLATTSNLSRKSGALDKVSIVNIAKRSLLKADGSGSLAINIESEDDTPWHAVATADQVLDDLVTSEEEGLSKQEAERRLKDFGRNALTPPKKASFFQRLGAQLNSILIYILVASAIVKGALQSWPAFGLVLGVVVANTAIGMIQEGKAEKAAEAIKAMLSPSAKVIRNGKEVIVPADELVPGDIVLLKSGDKVPADMRLLQAVNLQVQEAMLTGESVPASKSLKPCSPTASLGDRKCMCYSATAVVSGQARGVVVGTGDSAEIGQINSMVNTVEKTRNNLLYQLEILGRWLAVLVGIVALAAFLLALFRAKQNFKTAFESAVSIAVAIIPEGLPAMVTVVLAIGTTVMAKNNAIIRQLPAVETLGSLNMICSDKTGTLTKNEMTAVTLRTRAAIYKISGVGYAPQGAFTMAKSIDEEVGEVLDPNQYIRLQHLLEGVVLCNDSTLGTEKDAAGHDVYIPIGAPTEVALLTAGEKAGLQSRAIKAAKPRVASVPFESEHKFMATVHEEGGRRVMFVKGAPDRLLALCASQVSGDDLHQLEALDPQFWNAAQAELSSKGLRVLALCRTELEANEDLLQLSPKAILTRGRFLSMVMMVAILDPPRPEAIEAVKEAHRAGITVKMITGDHSLTALAIGRMLGIAGSGQVFTGPEVDSCNDEALRLMVMECNIYARASPENKLRIVRALQECKQTVAMTGDGVNDAPALKAADVGVAMGITGTDVSKEAAKMVLADDNFASIVAAVREGRRVWDNVRKILVFNLPVNLAQGLSVLYSYILGLRDVPLIALQVLLVNLVTSVTLGLGLAAEPAEPSVMDRPPRRPGKRLVGKLLLWRLFFVCHVVVTLVIGVFYWGGREDLSMRQRRAESFNVLVGAQVTYFIACRFIKTSTFHPRVFKGNKIAYVSVWTTIAFMAFFTYVPGVNSFFEMEGMEGYQWGRTAACMAIVYAVVELEKALVDPVLMPVIRPALRWVEAHTPEFLTVNDKRRFLPSCGKLPRTLSYRPRRDTIAQLRNRKSSRSVTRPEDGTASSPTGSVEVRKLGAMEVRHMGDTAV